MALFMVQGVSRLYWLPAVASPTTGPTIAEITAGIDLSAAITALEGFAPQSSKIEVPLLKYKSNAQIEGPQTFQDATVTLAEDDGKGTSADELARQAAEQVLVEGASGFVYHQRKTSVPAAGSVGYLMGATVGSQTPSLALGGSAATVAAALNPSTPFRKVTVAA